jgi:hypothetical protein
LFGRIHAPILVKDRFAQESIQHCAAMTFATSKHRNEPKVAGHCWLLSHFFGKNQTISFSETFVQLLEVAYN